MKPKLIVSVVLLVIVIIIAVAILGSVGRVPSSQQGPIASTSTPDVMGTSQQVSVTQADNGKVVNVRVGSRFVLKLGEEQWNISISDPSVIRRLPNFAMVRGAQGIYEVLKAGTTTISAQGRPVCAAGQMCAQYIIDFSTTIHAI